METRRAIRNGQGVVIGWQLDSGSVAPTHITVMDAAMFKLQLSGPEFDKMRLSSSEIVVNAYYRLANRNFEVDTQSAVFDAVASAAVLAGDWTQDRADELSLGIPV